MKPILMEDIAAFRTLTQLKMNPANTHVSFTMFTPDREENNSPYFFRIILIKYIFVED